MMRLLFHRQSKDVPPVPRQPFPAALLAGRVLVLLAVIGPLAAGAAEPGSDDPAVKMRITKPGQRLEMTVSTSQVLKFHKRIPRLFVADPSIVQATPLAPDQIQIAALAPGVTQLNLWDEQEQITTLDVMVSPDSKQLRELLESEFPDATLRVRPLARSVYITGYVPRPEMVHEITTLARDYYRDVINGITVGGVHQVALHVKVMEVSRTKLRQLGLDWEFASKDFAVYQGAGSILAQSRDPAGDFLVPGIGGDTVRLLVGDTTRFIGYLQALRQQNLVKLLAEPTLLTISGRPARFESGGEIPVPEGQGLGTFSIVYKTVGTSVDFVPIVMGNGIIRLEVHPAVTELNPALGIEANGVRIPGLTNRSVDTAVELQAGQTLALAGLIQTRVESTNKGVPFLGDLPYVGRAFSRVEEKLNEVELLIVVTPELVAPLNPHEVPPCGPGQLTVSPNDKELYSYGYLEVPNCAVPAPISQGCAGPVPQGGSAIPPPAEATLYGPGAGPDIGPSRRIESVPAPQPYVPNSSNNAIVPTNPSAARRPDTPSASNAREASQPPLYGPIGYEPLQ
jgi:pilus assembly protein CpaC